MKRTSKVLNIGNLEDFVTRLNCLPYINLRLLWSGSVQITTYDLSEKLYQGQNILVQLSNSERNCKLSVSNIENRELIETLETSVDNYNHTRLGLKTLGFIPYASVEVLIYEYEYRNLSIRLCKYPAIPAFLEMEYTSHPEISYRDFLEVIQLSTSRITSMNILKIHESYNLDYFKEYKI